MQLAGLSSALTEPAATALWSGTVLELPLLPAGLLEPVLMDDTTSAAFSLLQEGVTAVQCDEPVMLFNGLCC